MFELVLTFTKDICDTLKAVPHFHYRFFGKKIYETGAYERILQCTGDHHLAEDVVSWAEFAKDGETYECDELFAEVFEVELPWSR